jgi:FHA domain-containing protein
MALLEVETPDGSRRLPLERDRLSIGRLSYNDIVLAYAQISRQHAELRRIAGRWWIADLHSTNGLLLDSRRIKEHALQSGDSIMLAPGITIRFLDDHAAVPRPPTAPTPRYVPPASAASAPASVPPIAAVPFASAASSSSGFGVPPPLAGNGNGQSSETPFGAWSEGSPATSLAAWRGAGSAQGQSSPGFYWSDATSRPSPPPADGGGSLRSTGYPAPYGPLQSGAGAGDGDPYRRDSASGESARATAGPATLLHVCQTCGRLTAPDAVYCQHCRTSITQECPNCRLSLLPIQDRCPRCHTPNARSVRRAHTRPSGF